jgi:aminomethyltransferase
MKHTPLTAIHESLGAKMADFAGYNMPISYSGIKDEHQTVRNGVGVFDVSHMGEFMLRGPKALDLIQKVCTNDASKLTKGKAQYTCMTNMEGGIVDDLLIYCLGEEEYMLVVNAANIEKDWNWISENNEFGVEMENISDDMALLAIQGPKAVAALQSLTNLDLENMVFYTFDKGNFAGVENVIVSATGYTGSGGFEIYIPAKDAVEVWNKVFEAGESYGIKPIGLAARDTLRLEMGFCLYGNDIDDTTNPIEAGLGWITKFSKDFNASAKVRAVKEAGPDRKLVGIELIGKGVPRKDYELCTAEGRFIGHVTSGTMAPSLDKAIGMGYVLKDFAEVGTEICVNIRNKFVDAKVVKLPFF